MPSPLVSGFTLARNAIKLDFPVEASIRSILPLCDEVVVNVGRSEDDTLELIRAIDDPRIRIIESEWDFGRGYHMLAVETQRAMRACRHPWGVYIQADEVLHEDGIDELRNTLAGYDPDPGVEGLLVRYRHFYGTPDYLGTRRRWYRREVRLLRLDPALDVRSHKDAQGFRVGPDLRRIRVKLTGAHVHHYGWARPDPALAEKNRMHRALYSGATFGTGSKIDLPWEPGIRRFTGTHPAVVQSWVEQRRADLGARIGPRRWRWNFMRDYITAAFERATGHRMFEFRNYRIV